MVFMNIAKVDIQPFTDQTGCFLVTSNCGNNYIIIFYVHDANYIKSYRIKSCHRTELIKAYTEVYIKCYPIKTCHRTELIKAYTEVYQFLRTRGYRPQLHKLDNKTSKD